MAAKKLGCRMHNHVNARDREGLGRRRKDKDLRKMDAINNKAEGKKIDHDTSLPFFDHIIFFLFFFFPRLFTPSFSFFSVPIFFSYSLNLSFSLFPHLLIERGGKGAIYNGDTISMPLSQRPKRRQISKSMMYVYVCVCVCVCI